MVSAQRPSNLPLHLTAQQQLATPLPLSSSAAVPVPMDTTVATATAPRPRLACPLHINTDDEDMAIATISHVMLSSMIAATVIEPSAVTATAAAAIATATVAPPASQLASSILPIPSATGSPSVSPSSRNLTPQSKAKLKSTTLFDFWRDLDVRRSPTPVDQSAAGAAGAAAAYSDSEPVAAVAPVAPVDVAVNAGSVRRQRSGGNVAHPCTSDVFIARDSLKSADGDSCVARKARKRARVPDDGLLSGKENAGSTADEDASLSEHKSVALSADDDRVLSDCSSPNIRSESDSPLSKQSARVSSPFNVGLSATLSTPGGAVASPSPTPKFEGLRIKTASAASRPSIDASSAKRRRLQD